MIFALGLGLGTFLGTFLAAGILMFFAGARELDLREDQ